MSIRHLMPPAVDKPYVFHEYPKWIVKADGVRLVVANAEEEARETASPPKRETLVLPRKANAE